MLFLVFLFFSFCSSLFSFRSLFFFSFWIFSLRAFPISYFFHLFRFYSFSSFFSPRLSKTNQPPQHLILLHLQLLLTLKEKQSQNTNQVMINQKGSWYSNTVLLICLIGEALLINKQALHLFEEMR